MYGKAAGAPNDYNDCVHCLEALLPGLMRDALGDALL